MPRRCWLHTRAALLGHQIQNFYSSWALLNEFFTEWAVFQQLSHHQACSEQKNNTFKALQSVCWIQSWLYSSEYKGGLKVVLTLILAGPSPKAAFPCFINGFIEAFAQCVAGTLMNNTQTLKGSKEEFLQSLAAHPQREGTRTHAIPWDVCAQSQDSPGSNFSKEPDHCHYWGWAISCCRKWGVNRETSLLREQHGLDCLYYLLSNGQFMKRQCLMVGGHGKKLNSSS